MDIDRKRIAAMRALWALGCRYPGGEWLPPAAPTLSAGDLRPSANERDAKGPSTLPSRIGERISDIALGAFVGVVFLGLLLIVPHLIGIVK
jgi:hypothetical protein